MVNMGEVFSLIIRDEALHGVYVGLLFQEELGKHEEPDKIEEWWNTLAWSLHRNECEYTEELYAETGLVSDVKKFVRYNFNVCADNLGMPRLFEDEEIHPVVLNGITKLSNTHDFFSSKGSSYQKIGVVPLSTKDIEEAWNVK